jgi:hypothetical protein
MRRSFRNREGGEKRFFSAKGGYGDIHLYRQPPTLQHRKITYMPMLIMTSFPTICGPTKTAHRDASLGESKIGKKGKHPDQRIQQISPAGFYT